MLVPPVGELTLAATAAEVTAGAIFTGLGFVDRQRAAIEFLAIELRDRGRCLLLSAELHKREPAGFVGELVHDQVASADIAGLFEQVEHVAFRGVKRQVSYE